MKKICSINNKKKPFETEIKSQNSYNNAYRFLKKKFFSKALIVAV